MKTGTQAISPAIGVILMVAVCVGLVVLVGGFAFDFTDGVSAPAKVSVNGEFEPSSDQISAGVVRNANSDRVFVRGDGISGEQDIALGQGSTGTVNIQPSSTSGIVEVVAEVEESGNEQIIDTVKYGGSTGVGSGRADDSIGGSVFYNPPAEGVEVKLLNAKNNVVDTGTTGSDGSYSVTSSAETRKVSVEGLVLVVGKDIPAQGNRIRIDSTNFSDSIPAVLMDGDGSSTNPYKIETVADLQAIRYESDANYEIVNDIDASITSSSVWNGGAGFKPIDSFGGELDGSGYTIDGLNIERSGSDGVGIFSTVESGSTIKDVRMSKFDISGGNSVGVFAGENNGVVQDVSVLSGKLSGSSSVGVVAGENTDVVDGARIDPSFSYPVVGSGSGSVVNTVTLSTVVPKILSSTDSPVLTGEELAVDTNLTNTYDSSREVTVELKVDGSVVTSSKFTIGNDKTKKVVLKWIPEGSDIGTKTINVSIPSESESDKKDITVDSSVTAEDDSATVKSDSSVNINVLSNDEGSPLSINSKSDSSHGSVSVSDGNITYAPNTGYTGTDTLTYNVTDGVVTQQATVTVEVSNFPVFVDSFDDGSLSAYSEASGNTGPSDFTTSSSVAVSGQSAKISVSGTLDGFVASESSGLRRTPSAGDRFQIYIRSNTDSGSQSFIFGKNGNGAGYGVRMKGDNRPCCESNIAKLKADGSTLDSQSYNPDQNAWYRYVVNWETNGEIDVSIYDDTGTEVVTLSGEDSTYTSGAIELRYGFFDENGAGYFDEFKITGRA